jgi:hypothetical protein
MGREFHVRFCEGLGVKFPRATRLVIGFENEEDARRVMEVLPKRFGKYGLPVHPDKTRLLPFHRPQPCGASGGTGPQERPGVFDFLGFTHYWGKSKKGRQTVQRGTAASRIRRFTKAMALWCKRNRHRPIKEQHQKLRQKLQGHYNYYGITGNYAMLDRASRIVVGVWRKWLSRRSWESYFPWSSMVDLLERLPQRHGWSTRFAGAGKRLIGRAGCGKAASPDLWEGRRGNPRPDPAPFPRLAAIVHTASSACTRLLVTGSPSGQGGKS